MAALTDLSALINRLTGGNSGTPEHLWTWIDARVGGAAAAAVVANRWSSFWQYQKSPGANGAAPTAVAAPTLATTGALPLTNAAGGREKWLLGIEGAVSQAGVLLIYDRLLHIGDLSGTVTTAQTVGGTLTRYTGTASVGNQIWLEIYTQIGATSTTITASYTNQAGTAGRTTRAVAIGNTGLREAQRMTPLLLQDGDTGVSSVESVTLAGTTGTAGNFGVVIARPLLSVVSDGNGAPLMRDCISGVPAMPKIEADACLSLAWFASFATTPQAMVCLHMVES